MPLDDKSGESENKESQKADPIQIIADSQTDRDELEPLVEATQRYLAKQNKRIEAA